MSKEEGIFKFGIRCVHTFKHIYLRRNKKKIKICLYIQANCAGTTTINKGTVPNMGCISLKICKIPKNLFKK